MCKMILPVLKLLCVLVCCHSQNQFFFLLSYLIQIDTSVHCSFWLVALEEGLHSLVTHAYIGKVLS